MGPECVIAFSENRRPTRRCRRTWSSLTFGTRPLNAGIVGRTRNMGSLVCVLLLMLPPPSHEPRCSSFRVRSEFVKKMATPRTDADPRARAHRATLLREASAGVNFAGAYRLVVLRRRASRSVLAIVDLRNGEVHFPSPYDEWRSDFKRCDFLFLFQPTSRLIRACGRPGRAPFCTYFLEWTGASLEPIGEDPSFEKSAGEAGAPH